MSNYYIGTPTEGEALYHYGVKGMKWGVRKQREFIGRRNGSSDNMSIEQQKAARRAKAKKYAKVGAIVAGTALAAYGGYKLSKVIGAKKSAELTTAELHKLGISTFDIPKTTIATKNIPTKTISTKNVRNAPNSGRYWSQKKLTGHSQKQSAYEAARYKAQFYERKFKETPYQDAFSKNYSRTLDINKSRYEMKRNAAVKQQKILGSKLSPTERRSVQNVRKGKSFSGHSQRLTKLGAAKHREDYFNSKVRMSALRGDSYSKRIEAGHRAQEATLERARLQSQGYKDLTPRTATPIKKLKRK